jgi:hypothetical protein
MHAPGSRSGLERNIGLLILVFHCRRAGTICQRSLLRVFLTQLANPMPLSARSPRSSVPPASLSATEQGCREKWTWGLHFKKCKLLWAWENENNLYRLYIAAHVAWLPVLLCCRCCMLHEPRKPERTIQSTTSQEFTAAS